MHVSAIVTVILLLFNPFFIVGGYALENTVVFVQNVNANSSPFYINILCTPSIPIKAFELWVSFNNTLLQALEVIEGSIFDGYSTFFNSGDINNGNGTIKKIYNLIIGEGNVTTSGSLVRLKFESLTQGTSFIDLHGVGITNETMYIQIDVINGSINVNSNAPPNWGSGGSDGDGDGDNEESPLVEDYERDDNIIIGIIAVIIASMVALVLLYKKFRIQ